MTEPTEPTLPGNAPPGDAGSASTLPDERRADPPPPGSAWVVEHEPPASEAERQALETVRAVSRLEESN